MDFDLRKRKKWPDDGGVSEVIGNILILMITVILFSGIIAFVQQIPVPEQTTRADFSATIAFSENYRHANLTLVHAGGKVLPAQDIRILIEQDGTNYAFNLTDDHNFKTATWTTGKPWTIQLDGLRSTSVIVATIADLRNSQMIWTSQVTGGAVGSPPNILQRYVDSAPTTPTPDAVKEDDTFTLFVKVEDPDGDLSSVWINTLGVNISGSSMAHWDGTPWSVLWYRWDFNKVANGTVQSVDGNVIIIHAGDSAGHEAISSFILDITVLPSDVTNNLYPAYSQLGSSGLPLYLTYISNSLGYGFGFYDELLDANGTPTGQANTNSPSTSFWKDSNIFIRFGSLTMSNLFGQNLLQISDTRTGLSFVPHFPANSSSTPSAPFYSYPTGGSAYVYECMLDTTNLPPSSYTFSIFLMNHPSGGGTPQSFQAYQMILVSQLGAPPMSIPSIQVFKGGWTTAWGTTKDTSYDVSSSDANTIYVAVVVQNTDSFSPTIEQVRITDMSGGSELYAKPPAGSMVSKVRTLDGTRYNFTIALRLNNGNQWLPGKNSYTLYVTKLNDSNEGVYSLSQQIWITGAGGKADFFVGTSGISSGNANFITRYYPYYIQNNNFFTSQSMWSYENSPSACIDYTISALGVGDLNGDGGKDILMGQATSNSLCIFSNAPGIYGMWQPMSTIYRPDGATYAITWFAFGDMNGDGLLDFAYANKNSQIVLYNNTYGGRGWIFNPSVGKWTGTVSKIDLKDMTNDTKADLVVLAGGKLWIYDLKYAYDPVLKAFPSKMLWKSSTGTGIKDFDIKDMNRDGRLDIVTAGTSTAFGSNAGANVNLYGGTESTKELNENAAGFNPRMELNSTSTGSVGSTHVADGTAIRFTEATTGDDRRVSAIMRFNQTVSDTPDQVLRIRARISPGPTSETFYVWVSPDNSAYNYVGQIDATSYTNYNFPLPSTIMGTQMYLKFTDSLATPGGTTDYIEVDYAAVVTSAPGFTEKAVSADTTWIAARGLNVDNSAGSGDYLDVIAGKNGASGMSIYRWLSGSYQGWTGAAPSGSADFVVQCSGFVNDATNYPFSTLAQTMFDATDINGDGFTDLLVSNLTTSGSDTVTKIGFFMNLYSGTPTWRYFNVVTWTVNPPQKGPAPYADIVMAAPLYE